MFNTIEIDAKDGKKYKVSSVNIVKNDMEKEKRTYQAYINSKVVYDSNSYNFHVFPDDVKSSEAISNEFSKLREEIIIKLKSYDTIDFIKTQKEFKKKLGDLESQHTSKKHLVGGSGLGGTFTLFTNALKNVVGCVNDKQLEKVTRPYKYIEVYYKGFCYTINFMRYTCRENVVGCTMRAIQFHKAKISSDNANNKGYINYNKNNDFNICYTTTDEDGRDNIGGSKHYKTNGVNVCYNPPVAWPNMQPFDINATTYKFEEDLIKKIIDWFIYFIEKEGKLIDLINKEEIDKK